MATKNKLTKEGPILMSTTAVTGGTVMDKLREDIIAAKERGILTNQKETKAMILTGSHGGNVTGASALTDKEYIDYDLYEHDCRRVGLRTYPDPTTKPETTKPPDINEIRRIKRVGKSFLGDREICDMTFQVVNIAFYHNQPEKLVEDIECFGPSVIIIAWCFSINGDVAMALRKEGVFARMMLEFDIKEVSQNPEARLGEDQVQILEKMLERDDTGSRKYKDCVLTGPFGAGKTLFATEFVKQRMADLLSISKPFRVIVGVPDIYILISIS